MFQPDKFSDYIAILALVMSCASFYLSWQNFRRDRSRIRLNVELDFHTEHGLSYRVTATNRGRRTTNLMEVYALHWFREPQKVFGQETLLEEGRNKVIHIPFSALSSPMAAIRGFEARDSLGNKYRTGTLNLYGKLIFTKK